MIDDIDIELKRPRIIEDRSRGEAARRKVERDVPLMIRPWDEGRADLSDDLQPHVKRRAGILPLAVR
jgi:hypothetical protein